MELTGIYREATFSPFQHAENDRLILELTAAALQELGYRVHFLTEEEVAPGRPLAPVVFSMCQGPRANRILAAAEREGRMIVNSPRGVRACYRVALAQVAAASTLMPPTRLLFTAARDEVQPSFPEGRAYWLKRGDVHATQRGDVVKVCTPEEHARFLADFRARGIERVVLQQHVEGTVVKFYGVLGSPFFRFYAEQDYLVRPARFAAARSRIEELVRQIGLEVYGGDAVIDPDGRIFLIDLNDWPSFAYFRSEAARVIAGHIHRRALAALASWLERPRAQAASLLG